MQHLLKDSDLNKAQIEALIALGKAVKADPKKYSQALAGKSVVTLFEKPSLRTRVPYDIGIANLDSISSSLGFVSGAKELERSGKAISTLNIKPANPDALVGNLSGGNQQKVVVGKWLIRDLKLLIVDEPTVGVDIGAKEEMYQTIERLSREGVAVIVVSSDLPELTRLSDRIIVLRKGRIIKEFVEGVVTEEQVLRAASGIVEGGSK